MPEATVLTPEREEYYADLGVRAPRERLWEQANYTLELAKQQQSALTPFGWDENDTARLESLRDSVNTAEAKRLEEESDNRAVVEEQQRAIDEAKRYIRVLRLAAPRALRDQENGPYLTALIRSETYLDRDVSKIAVYLNKIQNAVAEHKDVFKKYMGGIDPVAKLAELAARLRQTEQEKQTSVALLPSHTRIFWIAKGQLLEAIRDVNAAGKAAFDGQATKLALFNQDFLIK